MNKLDYLTTLVVVMFVSQTIYVYFLEKRMAQIVKAIAELKHEEDYICNLSEVRDG